MSDVKLVAYKKIYFGDLSGPTPRTVTESVGKPQGHPRDCIVLELEDFDRTAENQIRNEMGFPGKRVDTNTKYVLPLSDARMMCMQLIIALANSGDTVATDLRVRAEVDKILRELEAKQNQPETPK